MPSNIRDLSKLKPRETYDDLFKSTGPVTNEPENAETKIKLSVLIPFKNHPFKIYKKEKLQDLADSINARGLLSPILVRPHPEGKGYEIIAGHNRVEAAKLLGWTEISARIRDMDDDEAVLAMVDSNMEQRDKILHSEKAWAYRMKLEAIKRQAGRPSQNNGDQVDHHLTGKKSRDLLAENSTDSGPQIQRYIRLTELIPGLLDLVDEEKIPFNVGVELSYLDRDQQCGLWEIMDEEECIPSLAQAKRMKERAKAGLLDHSSIHTIVTEEKVIDYKTVVKNKKLHDILSIYPAKERERHVVDSVSYCENLKSYFPNTMSLTQMKEANIKLLEAFNKKQREKRECER